MSDQPQDHGDHSHVHPTPGEVEATHESHDFGWRYAGTEEQPLLGTAWWETPAGDYAAHAALT